MKKVSFSKDTKNYDGSSYLNIEYAKMCGRFFNKNFIFGKIRTEHDILNYTSDEELVFYCIKEMQIIKEKIIENEKKNKFKKFHNILSKCHRFKIEYNKGGEYDSKWDQFCYINKSLQYQQRKISVRLLRSGTNIKFMKNSSLDYEHLKYVDYFLCILNRAYCILFEKKIFNSL